MVVLECREKHNFMESSTRVKGDDDIDATKGSFQRLFMFSARSEHSLTHYIEEFRKYLLGHESINLDDLSYTLASRRSPFQWRSSVTASNVESLIESLRENEITRHKTQENRLNVLIFTGQGAQWSQSKWHSDYVLPLFSFYP